LRSPREYMESIESGLQPRATPIGAAQLPFEFLLNALRLKGGFSRSQYETRTGLPLDGLRDRLSDAKRRGLLVDQEDGRWACSDLGYRFLNDLLQLFLPEEAIVPGDSYTQEPTMEPAAVRCD
jgi:coproporphyrinogen III oxidase-like Fe-S oxidoreductase